MLYNTNEQFNIPVGILIIAPKGLEMTNQLQVLLSLDWSRRVNIYSRC